ncbi:endospore germination permease [Proteiniborus sp.]|uniref:GerAB/ArcD/ProY family transporter n=1 Tax=Proteiniborus sp. TaxID=2079015 RepID=UPI003321BDE5
MEKTKISSRQFMIIVAIFTIGTSILITPGIVASRAKNDAWMVPIISIGVGVLVIWLYTSIVSLYPNKNIFEINEIILGKILGMLVNIFLIVVFFITVTHTVWYVGNFLSVQILTDIPIYATHIIYIAVIVYGARLGMETISRSAEIVFPVIIFLFILVILLVSPQSKYENILPFFEHGIKPILSTVLLKITILCLPLIILLAIPSTWVNPVSDYRKNFIMGYIIGGVVIVITTLFSLLVLGFEITSLQRFPTYILAKKVNALDFFQRLEPIIAIIWIVSIFYRTSFYMYISLIGLSHIFSLKDYKFITTPLGILTLGLSIIAFPNKAYQGEWDATIWVTIILIVGLLLPLVLLILGLIKKKTNKNK